MKLEVKAMNEDGSIALEGYLNRNEINFLIGFAVSELMADGVRFNIDHEEPDDEDEARIEYPQGLAN